MDRSPDIVHAPDGGVLCLAPEDLHPALGQMPHGYLDGSPQVMTVMFHLPTPEFRQELERLCRGRVPLYLQPEGRVAVLSSPDCDKGRGAARLASLEGFCLENAMALGDTGNDLPLLRRVGWPVVPENGSADALALALCHARSVTSRLPRAENVPETV